MKRYTLTCDLKNNPQLIGEYKDHHKKIWPEIAKSIRDKGVMQMEIYLYGNRMCMIMEVKDDFSFERASRMDADNIKVQEWENLMWKFQQSPPGTKHGEKWVLMDKIFDLKENT